MEKVDKLSQNTRIQSQLVSGRWENLETRPMCD